MSNVAVFEALTCEESFETFFFKSYDEGTPYFRLCSGKIQKIFCGKVNVFFLVSHEVQEALRVTCIS